MSAAQLYEQAIKPLSTADKLALARLILNDIAPNAEAADLSQTQTGFEYLKRLLPQIELITVTGKDLANIVLTSPLPE